MGLPINDLTPLGLGAPPPDDLRPAPGGKTPGEIFEEVYAAVAAAGLSPPQLPFPAPGEEPVAIEGFAAVESFASGRAESPVPLAQIAAGTWMPGPQPEAAAPLTPAALPAAADDRPRAGIELGAAAQASASETAAPGLPSIEPADAPDRAAASRPITPSEDTLHGIPVPGDAQVSGAAIWEAAESTSRAGLESGQGYRQVREPVSSGHADAPQGSIRPSAPTAEKPPVMPSAPAVSSAIAGQPGRSPSSDGPAAGAPQGGAPTAAGTFPAATTSTAATTPTMATTSTAATTPTMATTSTAATIPTAATTSTMTITSTVATTPTMAATSTVTTTPHAAAPVAPVPVAPVRPLPVTRTPETADGNPRAVPTADLPDVGETGLPLASADVAAPPQDAASTAMPVSVVGTGGDADLPGGGDAGNHEPSEAEHEAPASGPAPTHPTNAGAHAATAQHAPAPRDEAWSAQVADAQPAAPAQPQDATAVRPAPNSLRLDVDVANLGPISVNVRARGTEVATILAPQEPAAARVLAGQAAPLDAALAAQGLQLTGYEVLPQWQDQRHSQHVWDEGHAAPRTRARTVPAATRSDIAAAPGRLNYLI